MTAKDYNPNKMMGIGGGSQSHRMRRLTEPPDEEGIKNQARSGNASVCQTLGA